uniref:ATP synthase F0 subunit 8 n=1 Tax=Drawida japonica TaxID=408826 RepID=A0A0N6YQY7_9ANNE|nr:ATP synthase F0 subunit 8 [Drawida japonica]AIR76345.1 ATP synthase F0 subunit 8 [Drawida japonica]
MPHLSPMSWITALFSFWVLLMALISIMWWSLIPSFSVINIYSSHESSLNWKW